MIGGVYNCVTCYCLTVPAVGNLSSNIPQWVISAAHHLSLAVYDVRAEIVRRHAVTSLMSSFEIMTIMKVQFFRQI